ncbi:MAG: ester cyclase, partial [Deltaproteobacteria bacterium]|nr:ester cyclase [Deltaproteobacteria bacterium]
DDVEYTIVGLPEPIKGRAAVVELYKQQNAVLPTTVKAKRIFVTDDMWITQGVSSGTHEGEFQGVAATHNKIGNDFLHMGMVKDNKTVKVMLINNTFANMTQIGAIEGEFAVPTLPTEVEVVKAEGDAARLEVLKAIYAGLEAGTWDAFDANVAETGTHWRHDWGLAIEGSAAVKEALANAPVTETKYDNMMIALGDYVVVWGSYTGKATGKVGALQGDGRQVTVPHTSVFQFKDGKIVGGETYGDPIVLIAQMKTPPATAEGDEAAPE